MILLAGFIRKSVENKFILAIDWTKVEAHMAAVKANPVRIKLGKIDTYFANENTMEM